MRVYLRSNARRPDPAPLVTDDRRALLVGTLVWGVLLVAAVATRSHLQADGHGWWVWTPVAGIIMGLLGLRYVTRRRARAAISQARAARTQEGGPGSGG